MTSTQLSDPGTGRRGPLAPALSWARTGWAFVAVLLLAPAPWNGKASAQTPTSWIVLSEPGEWSDDRVLMVAVGSQIRVIGQAFHSDGILSITIGGQPAEVRPAVGGVVDFEGLLTIAPGANEVAVEARPTQGDPVRRSFPLLGTGAAQPPLADAAPPPPPPAAVAVYSPGGAMVRSLLVPGLGQFYTERPLLGVAFVGASVGAAAFGILSKTTTVRCKSSLTNGECPASQVHSRSDESPNLAVGVGAAVGIAALAAIEAYSAARRLNESGALALRGSRDSWLGRGTPLIAASDAGLQLGVRISH